MDVVQWWNDYLGWRVAAMRERYFQDFVYIHINKTGGTSVENLLGVRLEHKTALEKLRELGENRWRSKFTFTVIRNPWDKVVSHYHYRVMTNRTGLGDRPIEFGEWVRRSYRDRDPEYHDEPRFFMPQIDWITDEDGRILIDFIARFETLAEDLEVVRQRLDLSRQLPHEKRSRRGDYRDYYDDETRAIVGDAFATDIERFGYEF